MAIPLVLNETPSEYDRRAPLERVFTSSDRPDNAFNRIMYVSIPKAQSPLEQAERDRTWW